MRIERRKTSAACTSYDAGADPFLPPLTHLLWIHVAALRADCFLEHQIDATMRGSTERSFVGSAGVAQSVEQLIRNEKVGCSIHLSGTNIDKGSLLSK